jgi:hypothetical protein
MAVGVVGAIFGIIDVITRTIGTLRAAFAISSIIEKLTALRAALVKIREWVDSEPMEAHHQLVMDPGDTPSSGTGRGDTPRRRLHRCAAGGAS